MMGAEHTLRLRREDFPQPGQMFAANFGNLHFVFYYRRLDEFRRGYLKAAFNLAIKVPNMEEIFAENYMVVDYDNDFGYLVVHLPELKFPIVFEKDREIYNNKIEIRFFVGEVCIYELSFPTLTKFEIIE